MTPDKHLERIRRQIILWEYSTEEADTFIRFYKRMKISLFASAHKIFAKFAEDRIERSVDITSRAQGEELLACNVVAIIQKHVSYNRDRPLLPDVARSASANCVGFTTMFYAIACALDLEVRPIFLYRSKKERLEGEGHVCALVNLCDGRSIGMELTHPKGTSPTFIFSEAYTPAAGGWFTSKRPETGLFHENIQVGSAVDLYSSILRGPGYSGETRWKEVGLLRYLSLRKPLVVLNLAAALCISIGVRCILI